MPRIRGVLRPRDMRRQNAVKGREIVAALQAGCATRRSAQAEAAPARDDVAVVRRHYAREMRVAPEDVRVDVLASPAVPGITVFTASIDPEKLGRHATRNGIVEDGAVHTA